MKINLEDRLLDGREMKDMHYLLDHDAYSEVKLYYHKSAIHFEIKKDKAYLRAHLKDCKTSWRCFSSDIKAQTEVGFKLKGEIRILKT